MKFLSLSNKVKYPSINSILILHDNHKLRIDSFTRNKDVSKIYQNLQLTAFAEANVIKSFLLACM